MSKTKKLTQSALNKLDASLNEKKIVYVVDGQFECQIDKKFRKTKIQQLGIEYLEYLNQLKAQENVSSKTIANVANLLYSLTCKYFTDLPVKFENIDELTITTRKLLDLGIIEQLFSGDIEKAFDPVEIVKLNKELEKIADGISKTIGEMAYMSALNENIENSDSDGV